MVDVSLPTRYPRILVRSQQSGLGTCWLLDGMDGASSLISVDTDTRAQEIARSELGEDRRLVLVQSDGGDFLEHCTHEFDLIFADAWPGKYSHLEAALDVLGVKLPARNQPGVGTT